MKPLSDEQSAWFRVRATELIKARLDVMEACGVDADALDGIAVATELIDAVLATGSVPDVFGLPPTVNWTRFAYAPDGHAAYLLTHEGGSYTVIQVVEDRLMADRDDDFVLSGLLHLFDTVAPLAESVAPAKVNGILTCLCRGMPHPRRQRACDALGVLFVPLGPPDDMRATMATVRAAHRRSLGR